MMIFPGDAMRSFLPAVLLLGVLSGCVQDFDAAWEPYKQQYNESLARWIGSKETELVDHWGAPDRVYTLEGSKYVMYRLPRYRLCEQTFKITQGTVVNYNYNVKGCYAPARTYY